MCQHLDYNNSPKFSPKNLKKQHKEEKKRVVEEFNVLKKKQLVVITTMMAGRGEDYAKESQNACRW
jgi:hypothetical protein